MTDDPEVMLFVDVVPLRRVKFVPEIPLDAESEGREERLRKVNRLILDRRNVVADRAVAENRRNDDRAAVIAVEVVNASGDAGEVAVARFKDRDETVALF